MNIKQTVIKFTLGVLLTLPFAFFAMQTETAYATNTCGGVETSIITCDQQGDSGDVKDTGLWAILVIAINILIAGVGVLALAGIVYGAVLYTSAGGNAEQVKKAMAIFTNVVIGVIAFGGMWVLLNFLIPGGAFTNL